MNKKAQALALFITVIPVIFVVVMFVYESSVFVNKKSNTENILESTMMDAKKYNLIFENVGVNVATGVSILDYLPKEFVINYVKVVNGNITLERGIDYNYDENANPLLITDTGTSLNINPGEMLVVTINGKIPYLTD